MKDDNYFVVQGWMINRLKLSGNELNVFAIIYGFSQDDASSFDGSSQYLADFCGISKVSTLGILSKLTEKGFIQKTEKYVGKLKLCSYKTTTGIETLSVKKLNHSGKESLPGGKETYPVGGKETLPNKEYITNDINNNISKDCDKKNEVRHQYGEYKHVLLSDTEYSKLLADWGEEKLKHMIQVLDEGIEAKGYKYKNYAMALRTWEKNEKQYRSSPSYSNQKYHVEQGVPRRVDPEGEKEIHVDLPEDIF